MTIIVTGAGGMLGQAVVRIGSVSSGIIGFTHADLDITDMASYTAATADLPRPHIVINCAGIVKGRDNESEALRWSVNGVAPWDLAARCDRLVQVSTDCVFNGDPGARYAESHLTTPNDWYGGSKAHGEIKQRPHVTVRGSFIGFESGLLAWFMGQPQGATISGYEDHVWTGGYVDDYADALLTIAVDPSLWGVVHLVGEEITKAKLLQHFRFWLRPDIHVEEVLAPGGPRDMALKSTNPRVPSLPSWGDVRIKRMQHWEKALT